MNKRYIIVSVIFSLTVIVTACVIICNKNKNNNTFKEDGITYALMVDGESATSFPSKGMYRVDTECDGATGSWDYDNWKLKLKNITGNVECGISFNSITKDFLNQKIIGLAGTTQGTGQVVEENGYRYEGKNPNNFIWFNNELWRIIGVFDSSSHGQSGQNLVKIIRNSSIGTLVWDKSETNNWNTSSLKALLNGAYYNKQNGTNSGYCYGYSTTVLGNCDYSSIGIDSSYRGMIKNVTWYLGGSLFMSSKTSEKSYEIERGTTVYSGNPTSGEGYIGLMYPSDYGYSVLASSCARTTTLDSYNNAGCAGQSWWYKEGDEWTISHNSYNNLQVFWLSSRGYLEYGRSSVSCSFRPVLYLDALVYVMDGDGSMQNPYIIGMG